MPITLNHSNISVQYSSDKSYIIETVKSDLYLKNDNYDNIVRNNLQTAPVTPSIYIENGTNNVYAVESYTYSGSANTADFTRVFPKNTTCDILMIGGGGGGGVGGDNGRGAGGGGAGQFLLKTNYIFNIGTYNIKTGRGGLGGNITTQSGETGKNSSISTVSNTILLESSGGGGGARGISGIISNGLNGASGGGGCGSDLANTGSGGTASIQFVNNDTLYTGYNGASGGPAYNGGGGGGYTSAGFSATTTSGGDGGYGITNNITGVVMNYCAGGGGGAYNNGVTTGTRGGNGGNITAGNGGKFPGSNGGNATNGSGSGGGGGGSSAPGGGTFLGGDGGSGIVIIRYLLGTIPATNVLTTETEPSITPATFTETVRSFIHSGGAEAQTTHTITVGRDTICDILVVGGGGGGGSRHAGGGGAGAVIYSTNITLTAGTYTIGVGKGGNGAVGGVVAGQGNRGEDSRITFNSTNIYLAKGGGAGSHGISTGNSNKDGGSGGGGEVSGLAVSTNIPSGTYGNSGGVYAGTGAPESYAGGGGGGSGTAGSNATLVSGFGRGGTGGNGTQISITGTNVYYGGGGGGGAYTNANNIAGTGGLGGGGAGSKGTATAVSGTAGTGGGGGGGGFLDANNGPAGAGGSGIVIIRLKSLAGPIIEGVTHKRLNFAYNSDNLVAWYRFNGNYLDSSGNGHNLTNVGTVIQSTQVIEGQAVEFDSTDYLEFPSTINPYSIWNGKGITFSFWVRFTSITGTYSRFIDFQSGASSASGIFFAFKADPNAFYLNCGGTTLNYSNSSIITTLGVWHHIVWSIDITGKWDVYLNNVRINNTETSAVPNITYNLRYINKSTYPGNGVWGGQIDDFRIYSRAISAADVASLYNKTYPVPANQYALNFPVPTIADINNNSNIVLRGAYDIALSSTNSAIIPKEGQYILPPTTFTTSNLSLRYHLLNPTLDPIGAQWTYSSNNTNVYHMGRVGIGTTNPEYQLDVRGFIFTSVGGYTQTGSENWVVQSDRRIKENIVKASYEKCLDNVKKIELYNFNFKDNCVNTNDKNQLGFIAQEVQQVYPKAVEVGRMTLDNNQGINDLLTLNTTQIKYTLYGAVKNLIERVENIESRVEQIYNMTLSSNIKSSSSNISITFITPLTPNITTNTSNISTNTSNISTNTSNITTNSSNISTNTSNITTNTSNITTNSSNITTNSSNITTNSSNITTNTSNTDTSNIDISNIDTSNIDTSNIDTSNIDTSNIDTSDMNTSNIDTSNIDTSNIDTSVMNTSNIDTSNIDTS